MAQLYYIYGCLTWVKYELTLAYLLFPNPNVAAFFFSPIAGELPRLNPITRNMEVKKICRNI